MKGMIVPYHFGKVLRKTLLFWKTEFITINIDIL